MPSKGTTVSRACVISGSAFQCREAHATRTCSRPCRAVLRFGSPESRFWGFVEKLPGGCWRWTGPVLDRHLGYGRIKWKGRDTLAHHISWLLQRGPIPAGKIVRHVCPNGGNAWCVNPEHLALGTQTENVQDMMEQGRHWSQTGAWSPPKGIRLKPPHCPTCSC